MQSVSSCERALPLALPLLTWHVRADACERALPLALPAGGLAAPQTPCNGSLPHDYGIGACLWYTGIWMIAAYSTSSLRMCAKRSAHECIESGIQGTASLAGGAGGAAAPCRPPCRRTESISNRGSQGRSPGPRCRVAPCRTPRRRPAQSESGGALRRAAWNRSRPLKPAAHYATIFLNILHRNRYVR